MPTAATGYVRVELLDPFFQPYEGFSAQQCDPLIGAADQLWHTVRWPGGSDLRLLWGQTSEDSVPLARGKPLFLAIRSLGLDGGAKPC